MKWCAIGLTVLATTAQADSLCGVTDAEIVIEALQGGWDLVGSYSVETETLSAVRPTVGSARVDDDRATIMIIQDAMGTVGTLAPLGLMYDVDQVDDMLETVEAEWMADDLSATPCGPEGLLQLSHRFEDAERDTRLTVLPYFDDRMLVIVESEMTGEWGIAFTTYAGVMTRE